MTDLHIPRETPQEYHEPNAWAVGWIVFAAVMMVMIGSFHVIAGLVAIFDDDFFTQVREYVFDFSADTWGWIHLILGIVLIVAGAALFTANVAARTVGVILAVLSALVAFTWLPYYPIWAIVMVAVAVSVIWALTAHGRDITAGS